LVTGIDAPSEMRSTSSPFERMVLNTYPCISNSSSERVGPYAYNSLRTCTEYESMSSKSLRDSFSCRIYFHTIGAIWSGIGAFDMKQYPRKAPRNLYIV